MAGHKNGRRGGGMNTETQSIVVALLGGLLISITLSGRFTSYVKPGFAPLLLIGGGILVVVGVGSLILAILADVKADRSRKLAASAAVTEQVPPVAGGRDDQLTPMNASTADDHDAHAAGDAHGHDHSTSKAPWLILVPVLVLLLVAPPALGSYAAGQSGTVLTAPGSDSDYPALPAGDPVDLGLLDYASRAVFDGGRSLTGRTVRLTGFVTPGPDGEPMLARMVVSCCAADGRPIKVGLDGDTRVTAASDAWVQVVGAWTNRVAKDPVNQADVPYLKVTAWQEIPAPKQPYE